jgi:polysaccharide pyruvyl transferase WcaK-like protein
LGVEVGKNKKVKIFGVIGENLGDEALGVSAYKFLSANAGSLDFYIGELINNRAARNGVDSFLIDRKSIFGVFKIIFNIIGSDVVLVGGGSLIQDKIGISFLRGTLPYIFQITFFAKLFGKKVYSLPMGVDDLNTSLGLKMARLCLSMLDGVYVRDNASRNNVLKYLNKDVPVTVCPDPAFIYECDANGFGCYGRYAVICLAKEKYSDELYFDSLVYACKKLVEQGISIKFVSMDEKPHEDPALNDEIVRKMMFLKDIEVVAPGGRLESIVNTLRGAEVVIAMRLHAVILAYGYAKCIMISRTTKTDALMEDYRVSGVSIASGESVGESVIWDIYNSNDCKVNFELAESVRDATRHGMRKLINQIGSETCRK